MAGIISSTLTDDVEAVAPPPRAQVPDGEERVDVSGTGTGWSSACNYFQGYLVG